MSKSRDIADSAATINFIDNLTSDAQTQLNTLDAAVDNISVTAGSLTKTLAAGEQATITLSDNVSTPLVDATKEVPQIGVTNNDWNVDSTAQNYTRQDVAVSTTLNFVPDILNIDTGTAETWNISNYGTSNVGGICFSADGLVAAFVELTLHSITFGNFTTAYDLASLASADSGNDLRIGGTSPSAVSYGENPTGVKFGNNDTKMYVSCRGPTNDTRGVAQYSITFDVDSGTHTFTWDGFFSTGEASPPGQEPTDVAFNSDGTKMYVLDNSGTNGVLIYDLTTPWDITGTVTYNSQYSNAYPFAAPHNEYGPSGMCFSADGSYVWFLGIDTDRIYQLNLSTPYDLTTNTGGTGLSFAVSYVSYESTGVFVSPDNSRLFFTDQQNNRTRQLTLPVLAEKGEEPVDFSLAYTSYSQALDVTSDSSGVVRGLSFNDDGTKVYFVGDNTSIYQWDLTSAFDLSTATSSGNTFNVGSQEGGPQDVCFNNDGTKMFVTGTNADDLVEYALSSAYDITTATFTTQSTGTICTNPKGIAFNNDGTILFAVGGADLYAWSLGTGFDTTTLNTSAFLGNNNYNSLGLTDMTGIQFSSDGLRMLISCTSSNTVSEFSLSTAFDITTASGTITSQLSTSGQSSDVSAVRVNNDMSKLYISGGAAFRSLFEYNVASSALVAWRSDEVGTELVANGGVFTLSDVSGSFATKTSPTSTGQVAAGNWQQYRLSFNYGVLEPSAYVDNFDFATTAESYQPTFYGMVSGATNPECIRYSPNTQYYFTVLDSDANVLSRYYQDGNYGAGMTSVSHQGNQYINSQTTNSRGFCWGDNGLKLLMVDQNNIFEYNFASPYNVNGSVSYVRSGSLGVSSVEGVEISDDGLHLYIVSSSSGTDKVAHIPLTTAFSVSGTLTPTTIAVFATATGQSANHYTDIQWHDDGKECLLITENSPRKLTRWTLTTPYRLETASFLTEYSLPSNESSPKGFAVSPDGTALVVVGGSGARYFNYTLGTGVTAGLNGRTVAITNSPIDSEFWTDINSMTVTETPETSEIDYAVSTDGRTTWSVAHDTNGIRPIVRNNSGTWQLNSNTTYSGTTWVNGTTNDEMATLIEAQTSSQVLPYQLSSASSITFGSDPGVGGTQVWILKDDGTRAYWVSTSQGVIQADLGGAFSPNGGWGATSQNSAILTQDNAPRGIRFSSDGATMFICGSQNDNVYSYALSTPWDATTSTLNHTFDVGSTSPNMGTPSGISFSENGLYMYMVDISLDVGYQFNLTAAWDLSTASYSGNSFNFSGIVSSPQSFEVTDNGTRGYTNDTPYIKEFSLSTPYDISTASITSENRNIGTANTPIQVLDGGKYIALVNSGGGGGQLWNMTATVNAPNGMDKGQLDAVTDPNHFTLGNDLDLGIIFNYTSGDLPSSDGVAINYDANTLNQSAIPGTDYEWNFPASNEVKFKALNSGNYKVRVV